MNDTTSSPIDVIVFAQHGMSDDHKEIGALAHRVASFHSLIISPNLGFTNTFFKIEPLIKKLEHTVEQTFCQYPDTSARMIATSLGGVIWIEVLARHPDWWSRFESLVLLGSPIGGADLARIVDPFGWGIGIAKYLGQNRRSMAEEITAVIPTLVVAGNVTGGGDCTVSIESTKLKHAHFICLNGVTHNGLKTNSAVAKAIQEFWSKPRQPLPASHNNRLTKLIEHFRAVPGITDASQRDFSKSLTVFSFADGTSLRTWTNIVGVEHIFIANAQGHCEYAAFVGWIHTAGLRQAIDAAMTLF